MTGQHTPGDWHVVESDFGMLKVVATDPGKTKINRDICEVGWAEVNHDGRHENACLIAAAPAMLAALQSIAEYWNREQNTRAMVDALDYIAHTADEAIAKAEGREVTANA